MHFLYNLNQKKHNEFSYPFSDIFNKRERFFALKDPLKVSHISPKVSHTLYVIQLLILDTKRLTSCTGHPVIGKRHKYFQVEVDSLCFSSLGRGGARIASLQEADKFSLGDNPTLLPRVCEVYG